MCSTTWRKIFLIEQIFVKRRSFEPKSSFFEQKSFKKELLIGKCFVTKKYVHSKKIENEEVLSENFFTFMPVALKKRLLLTFQKFKIVYLTFNPPPPPKKKRQIQKCALIEPPFGQRTLGNLNFSKIWRGKGFPSTSFFKIQIEIETVVMTSRSQKLTHLEI